MGKQFGGTRKKYPTKNNSSVQKNTLAPATYSMLQDKKVIKNATAEIKKLFKDIEENGHPTKSINIKIGEMPDDVVDSFKNITNIEIEGKEVYTSTKALTHHRGGQKAARNKETPIEDLVKMPSKIKNMDVYENKKALIFTDYKNKYVVFVNKKIKLLDGKNTACCHISSSAVVDKGEFKNYNVVKKIKKR